MSRALLIIDADAADEGDAEVSYENFRTGLTFRDVRRMLWMNTEDRSRWRNKRRRGVLGNWAALKEEMYAAYLGRRR